MTYVEIVTLAGFVLCCIIVSPFIVEPLMSLIEKMRG